MTVDVQKLTFFERNKTVCPVCGAKFYREELLSGGGRLIAGELTEELRRSYEPSKRFGEVHPLVYPVTVCPTCYFSAYPQDFSKLPDNGLKMAEVNADERRDAIGLVFPELDFTSPRTLKEGAASHFFAIMCYDFFDRRANPTFKAGLSALRAAWLFSDLHARLPADNYDYLFRLFYRKARFYYMLALEKEQKGQEAFDAALNFGPDLDKNYGYDGAIYVAAYLDYRYGSEVQPAKRVENLEFAKRMIAKVFGVGRASKAKPSVVLDKAKEIYDRIGEEVKRLKGAGAADGGPADSAEDG
jgi:uncharacterized protein (DUF2225 family)